MRHVRTMRTVREAMKVVREMTIWFDLSSMHDGDVSFVAPRGFIIFESLVERSDDN